MILSWDSRIIVFKIRPVERLTYLPLTLFMYLNHERTSTKASGYLNLVYTTQVNSTFRARWLASSEVISQVLFTSISVNNC